MLQLTWAQGAHRLSATWDSATLGPTVSARCLTLTTTVLQRGLCLLCWRHRLWNRSLHCSLRLLTLCCAPIAPQPCGGSWPPTLVLAHQYVRVQPHACGNYMTFPFLSKSSQTCWLTELSLTRGSMMSVSCFVFRPAGGWQRTALSTLHGFNVELTVTSRAHSSTCGLSKPQQADRLQYLLEICSGR